MSEVHDATVVEAPKPTLRQRVLNKNNAKRGGIIAAVVLVAVWLKRKLNASGSASLDAHVETADNTDN